MGKHPLQGHLGFYLTVILCYEGLHTFSTTQLGTMTQGQITDPHSPPRNPTTPASSGAASDFQGAAERATDLLKLMANERRLMILCHLLEGPKSVGELEGLVGLRQAALSQHLAKLRNTGLVKTRREAQTIFYSLASHEVEAIIGCLHGLFCQDVEA